MGATPKNSAAAPTPKRQSCDRCRSHKLRCSRANKSLADTCDRCLRKGAVCVYSFSLPKGRPSVYELPDREGQDRNSPSTSSASPKSSPNSPIAPKGFAINGGGTLPITTANMSPLQQLQQQQTAELHRGYVSLGCQQPASDLDTDIDMGFDVAGGLFGHADATTNSSNTSSNSASISNSNSSSISSTEQSDETAVFDLPVSMSLDTEFGTLWSWQPEGFVENADSPLDIHALSAAACHADPSGDVVVSHGLGPGVVGASASADAGMGQDRPGIYPGPGSGCGASSGSGNTNSSLPSGHDSPSSSGTSGFEPSIAHLSQLSARLSQILRSRAFLAETSMDYTLSSSSSSSTSPRSPKDAASSDTQPFAEVAFQSINSWLGPQPFSPADLTRIGSSQDRGNSTTGSCDVLHQIFSASNHLLEILRYLHQWRACNESTPTPPSVVNGTTTGRPATPASSHSSARPSSRARGAASGCDAAATVSDQPYGLVIRHLILTCVTLLLDNYVMLLETLQRNADSQSPSLQARMLVEPSDQMDAASRGHIQLVSVVQLCSYFINRLRQILDVTLLGGANGSLNATPLSQGNDPHRPGCLDASFGPAVEAMMDLRNEVDLRLRRLQESLCIL